MKKYRILLVILSLFLLVGCSNSKVNIEENSNNIATPETKLASQGIWKNVMEYDISEDETIEIEDDQLFISRPVIEFKDSYILNPNISSRLVNFNDFITTKITNLPEELSNIDEQVVIHKFSNNVATSQEFIELSDGRLLTIYLGNIIFYEKVSEVSEELGLVKYEQAKKLTAGSGEVEKNNFGLAISFRVRDESESSIIKHNYYTYYMKQASDDIVPRILKVRDIILPKSTGLWTVRQEILDNSHGGFTNYKLSANPSFIDDEIKTNVIQDNLYRRIDYVDRDYIGVTNFNYNTNSISESYNIFNIHELASKEPLYITEIAGPAGYQIYQSTFKENANILYSSQSIPVLDIEPDPDNIGVQRTKKGWKFVSGIDQEINSLNGSRVYRKFDLNINPIINIGNQYNTVLSWRDILARKPGAVDATVSPDNNFVLIQSKNSIDLYPIYYNYIGNSPLFTIQNVNNYEIVMIQWINGESINNFYTEFNKLPKLNNNIIYP